MISKNKAFLFFSFFFLFAVFINNIFLDLYKTLWVLLIIIILFFIYILISNKYPKYIWYIILFVILWYIWWTFLSHYKNLDINTNNVLLFKYIDNNRQLLELEIKEVSKKDLYKTSYIAKVNKIWNKKIDKNIYSIIVIPSNLEIKSWYIILSKVKLYSIKNIWDNFDYKSYLLSKNIYFKSYINYFDIINKQKQSFYTKGLYSIRSTFLSTINKIYTKEEGVFLWWILVWAREEMPKSLKLDFNNSWLTHFIAVSWFNITILIIFFSYFFSYFPLFLRVIFITFFIISFTILVWDSVSVIRATIMWLVWYYVMISGREWNALSIILFTAVILILFSPLSLNYDVSLHLSFLAVIWIIYTQKFWNKIFNFLPSILAIKEAFVLSLSALTFALPIIIFNFGQISILSPIANILVAWTIPLAMLFWFLSIMSYLVSPIVWIIIWYLTWILLKWDILIVHYFGQSSWAIIEFNFWNLKNFLELLYFIIILFLVLYFRWKKKETT